MSTLSGTGQSALNCMYWGFVLATVLLGATLIQGFIYYKHYQDKRWLQVLVMALITLDIVSSALMAHVVFSYAIENYGNPASLANSPPPSLPAEYFTTAIVAFLCQMFYASQIFKLRRHSQRCMVPFVSMILFSVAALLSNAVAVFLIVALDYFEATFNVNILKVFTSLGNCAATSSDVISCVALCLFLASHRADIGHGHTALVDTLIFYTINRGVLFSVVQLGHMVAYVAAPTMLYWLPFHLCVSKLHVNSLLALMNSRQALRGAVQQVSKITFHVDQAPAAQVVVQKTHSQLMRPIELHCPEGSASAEDDVKIGSSPPNATLRASRSAELEVLHV